MTTDHARQDLQTNGVGVRDVRPRDGRENTPRFFWNTGWKHRPETPDGKNPTTYTTTEPTNNAKMGAEHEHPRLFGAER